jgi:hypothetical protein
MSPSAMLLRPEFEGKSNSNKDFKGDVDRTIQNISNTLHKTIKHASLPSSKLITELQLIYSRFIITLNWHLKSLLRTTQSAHFLKSRGSM